MRAIAAVALVLLIASIQPAFAERRAALVIGNAAYQHVNKLANPGNDSELMAATLKDAGFEVVELRRDLPVDAMRRALRDFSDQARDADIAIIYYAGHGLEIDGINYLIPVDAVLERDIDAYDEAIPLDRLLTVTEPAKRLRLIILDACRDNPFSQRMKRSVATRAISRGLARVEPSSPNTLIAFSAKAGSTAADGSGKYSPFTTSLVKYLTKPGLDLRRAFGFTRDEVLKITNNQQEPFVYGSLGGDDVALVPAPPAPPPDPDIAVRYAYELALQVGTREIWDSFISNYPNSFYTDLARAQRRKIVEAQQAAEAARLAAERKRALEEAKAVEAERARAAAQAKAEEDARLAAEKAKAEQEKRATEAERAGAAEQTKAEEDAALAEVRAKGAAENAPDAKPPQQVAALTPQESATADPQTVLDIPRLLQAELHRVGCGTGNIDQGWSLAAQKSLTLFNKHAGTSLDTKTASLGALDIVRSKPDRVCPLICEHGYRADTDRCVKITCDTGFVLNDDNECVKKREKPAREERATRRIAPKEDQLQSQPAPHGPGGDSWNPHDRSRRVTMGGYQTCGHRGCQTVPKGCAAVRGMGGHGLGGKIFCP